MSVYSDHNDRSKSFTHLTANYYANTTIGNEANSNYKWGPPDDHNYSNLGSWSGWGTNSYSASSEIKVQWRPYSDLNAKYDGGSDYFTGASSTNNLDGNDNDSLIPRPLNDFMRKSDGGYNNYDSNDHKFVKGDILSYGYGASSKNLLPTSGPTTFYLYFKPSSVLNSIPKTLQIKNQDGIVILLQNPQIHLK